jgi:glycosyltransferase involved in cell wall biosynthesis
MHGGNPAQVTLIIPALDEEATIARVVGDVPRDLVQRVVVVDNGSKDDTGRRAADAGAEVITERRRGYGSACLAGIAHASDSDVFVFADGDGSDDLTELRRLLTPVVRGEVDLVIGSRTRGACEPGALTPIQRFGNWLTCGLVRLFWRVEFSDLGPLRAIHREALRRLEMSDPDFGWTVEMQVKAAQRGLSTQEIPVRYRCRRAGQSKVSGTLVGSYLAGRRILGYVVRAKLDERRAVRRP